MLSKSFIPKTWFSMVGNRFSLKSSFIICRIKFFCHTALLDGKDGNISVGWRRVDLARLRAVVLQMEWLRRMLVVPWRRTCTDIIHNSNNNNNKNKNEARTLAQAIRISHQVTGSAERRGHHPRRGGLVEIILEKNIRVHQKKTSSENYWGTKKGEHVAAYLNSTELK